MLHTSVQCWLVVLIVVGGPSSDKLAQYHLAERTRLAWISKTISNLEDVIAIRYLILAPL